MIELTQTHEELLSASQEIGAVYEMSAWASDMIAASIEITGVRVDDMTVGALRALIRGTLNAR